jgi:cytochrome P450
LYKPFPRTSTDLTIGAISGPFGCPGKEMAHHQLRVAVALLLLTYDVKLAPQFDRDAFMAGIYRMRSTMFSYPLTIIASQRL